MRRLIPMLLTLSAGAAAQSGVDAARECPQLASLLVTQLAYGRPVSSLERVEARVCGPGEQIRITAWKGGESMPALAADTTDFTIVQVAAKKNVFVIETTGGPRNQVFVIVYEGGTPKLKKRLVTRGYTAIETGEHKMRVRAAGIYAGDAPPRTEEHEFVFEQDR